MNRFVQVLLVTVAVLVLSEATTLHAAERATKPKNVVLVAGVKSHGPEGNGIHDYGWSVRLLHAMLEQSNAKEQLRVTHHLNGWPKDPKAVEDADTIIVISDGRDGEKYSEALHLESKERVEQVDRLMKRGCGMVLIHFSNFAPEQYAEHVLRWVGGYFKWETDGKRQWSSAIKTLDAEVKPLAVDHPVLRGVKPFRMKEEFYYNLRFAADDGATAKVLSVADLKSEKPDGNVVAWARQRPGGEGGGRGFGSTCGHFYANWENADFRRTVLNAIVWTAGAEVPKEGVEAKYIPREKLVPSPGTPMQFQR